MKSTVYIGRGMRTSANYHPTTSKPSQIPNIAANRLQINYGLGDNAYG
jgi:hypothetical protein